MSRRRTRIAIATLVAAWSLSAPPAHVPVASADILELGWTAEGYIDPAAGEGQRAQIALDAAGTPTAVWAARATVTVPFRLVSSTLVQDAWTPAAPFLPSVTIDQLLPQLSRAPDGTLWLAWLEHDDSPGSSNLLFSTLLCARYADGAWSAPEVITPDLGRPNTAQFAIEFSLLGVSRDSAWIAYMPLSRAEPFSTERDLEYRVRSSSGWSAPGVMSSEAFAEWRPVLAPGRGGQPAVFFGYRGDPSVLRALRWNGAAWTPAAGDTLRSAGFFQWAAAPDTNGAVRLLVMQREGSDPYTDRIREFAWNDGGFAALDAIAELPVVGGQGTIAPQWDGLAYLPGAARTFRALWVDFSLGSIPIVASALRGPGGFELPDVVGRTYAPEEAYSSGAYEAALDRWYAVWIGAPTSIAVRRPKFAWTQEFAGDLGIGGRFIAPDTVRVTVACSGDAAGRTIRVYRLNWDDPETFPPFPPPIPAQAVELTGSPTTGPCPFQLDDFPGDGRWFYYVELLADGTFPDRAARSFTPIVIGGEGGGGTPERSALRAPRPRPSRGTVTLAFDLASPGEVAFTVQDLLGRVRRRIASGAFPAGAYGPTAPQWDGRDDAGRDVPSGVYFVRLWVDGRPVDSERVVILR